MKRLLVLLAFIPFTLSAQTVQPEKTEKRTFRNEIGLSIGLSSLPVEDIAAIHPLTGIRYLRNYGNTQLGIDVSVNSFYGLSSFSLFTERATPITPVLLFNKTYHSEQHYLYIGLAAGYYQDIKSNSVFGFSGNEKGYILGAQGGISYHVGKHISLNAELAIRSAQVWYKGYTSNLWQESLIATTYTKFRLYTPLTLAIRYRF